MFDKSIEAKRGLRRSGYPLASDSSTVPPLRCRKMDYIVSLLNGQATRKQKQVHNLFLTFFCPMKADHLSLTQKLCQIGQKNAVGGITF